MRFNKMAGYPQMMQTRHEVAQYFNVDLDGCPFCGGVPALYMGPSPHVVCTSCAADGPTFEANRENMKEMQFQAIKAWNTRAKQL